MEELLNNPDHCKLIYEQMTGGEYQQMFTGKGHVKIAGFEDSGNSELEVHFDGEILYKRRGAYQLLPLTPFSIVKIFNELGYKVE